MSSPECEVQDSLKAKKWEHVEDRLFSYHICNRFDFHGHYGRLEHLLHFCFSLVFAHACGFFLFFLIFTYLFQFYYNYNLLQFSLSKSLEKGTLNQTFYLFLILIFFISCAPSEIAYLMDGLWGFTGLFSWLWLELKTLL